MKMKCLWARALHGVWSHHSTSHPLLSLSLHSQPAGQGTQPRSPTPTHRISNNPPLASSSRLHKLNTCHESLGWEPWAGLTFSPAFISAWNVLFILDVCSLTLGWHTHTGTFPLAWRLLQDDGQSIKFSFKFSVSLAIFFQPRDIFFGGGKKKYIKELK